LDKEIAFNAIISNKKFSTNKAALSLNKAALSFNSRALLNLILRFTHHPTLWMLEMPMYKGFETSVGWY